MANPYIDNKEQEPTPGPTPAPPPAQVNLVYVAIVLGIAGLLLPPSGGWDWDKLRPEPPPYVEPGPGPAPTPLVDPAKTEGAWVVVIEQTESRTPAVAKVMNDTKFWKSLESRGLNWRHYDADSPDAKLYLPAAKAIGLPALFIVGGKGELLSKVLGKAPLPPTTSEIDTLVKKATGR